MQFVNNIIKENTQGNRGKIHIYNTAIKWYYIESI